MNPTKALVEQADDDALKSLVAAGGQTLEPTIREFARWLAENPNRPKKQQLDTLQFLTGYAWTEPQRLELLASGTFRTYWQAIRERSRRTLDIRVLEVAVDGVEALDWAIKKARREGDHRAIPTLVTPALERAMPRRSDIAAASPTIIIQISGKQQAVLESVLEPLQAEIIETLPPESTV